jgi:hypothetical protein
MKRTWINKLGKRGKANLEANKRLRVLYEESDIRSCELNIEGCENYPLQYCHRHERDWYKGNVELLSRLDQCVLGCQWCHNVIDTNKKLRERKFLKLRGKDRKSVV